MSDEEFSEWLDSHQKEIEKIESTFKINIASKAELVLAIATYSQEGATKNVIALAITRACQLLGTTGGLSGAGEAVEHGHTQTTYGVWVNSLFYGYKGRIGNGLEKDISTDDVKKGNDNSFTIRSIRTIGKNCFSNSSIQSFSANECLKYIGEGSFSYCNQLSRIDLGSAEKADKKAFRDCVKLNEVTMPGDMAYVQDSSFTSENTFNGTTNVEKIIYTPGEQNIILDRSGRGEDGTNRSENHHLEAYSKESLTEVVIQDGITRIGDYAFYNDEKLVNVTVPSSVEEIGEKAFRNTGITAAPFSTQIKEFGKYALNSM